MERRIKVLLVLSAVILPVTVALYILLPLTPAASVLVGLLFGFGASIPVGILLALWTERRRTTQPLTTVIVSRMLDNQHCELSYSDGSVVIFDLVEMFGQPAAVAKLESSDFSFSALTMS